MEGVFHKQGVVDSIVGLLTLREGAVFRGTCRSALQSVDSFQQCPRETSSVFISTLADLGRSIKAYNVTNCLHANLFRLRDSDCDNFFPGNDIWESDWAAEDWGDSGVIDAARNAWTMAFLYGPLSFCLQFGFSDAFLVGGEWRLDDAKVNEVIEELGERFSDSDSHDDSFAPLDCVNMFRWRPRVEPRGASICAECGSATKLTCSGCSRVRYCSKKCQKSQRWFHKSICRSLGRSDDARKEMGIGGGAPVDGPKPSIAAAAHVSVINWRRQLHVYHSVPSNAGLETRSCYRAPRRPIPL